MFSFKTAWTFYRPTGKRQERELLERKRTMQRTVQRAHSTSGRRPT